MYQDKKKSWPLACIQWLLTQHDLQHKEICVLTGTKHVCCSGKIHHILQKQQHETTIFKVELVVSKFAQQVRYVHVTTKKFGSSTKQVLFRRKSQDIQQAIINVNHQQKEIILLKKQAKQASIQNIQISSQPAKNENLKSIVPRYGLEQSQLDSRYGLFLI